jgi:hypothetical protein
MHSVILIRDTLHPILHSRVGPDQFVSRIHRLREDARFKNVGPDVLEFRDDVDGISLEDGVWFDWALVEFIRNSYCPWLPFTLCSPV